ncbi:MAG: thioredoxin-dependent thiol peroxidase [Gemmatimonadales bacterium]
MVEPGSPAPPFALPNGDGDTVALHDLHGRQVVLYFYPKDDTPGCTTQACDLRDSWRAIQEAGAVVLGVSPDGPASHARFARKFQLPFPLLADEDHAVAEAYGAWGEKSMYGRTYMGIIRSTVIIDGDGIVSHVFPRVRPKGHAAIVLAALVE